MAVVKAMPYAPMCAEDLLAPHVPEKFVELIEGELVEVSPPTFRHEKVCGNIYLRFRLFQQKHPVLEVGTSNTAFVIHRNPDTMFCPDVSLFRRRPWPHHQVWGEFAPELCVEVRSPSNSQAEMVYRKHRLFEAGTEQFWLVEPDTRQVHIFHKDSRQVTFSNEDAILCEGIAEGLAISLSDIFSEQ